MSENRSFTPEGKFTYEWIAGRTANDGHFRIADAHDNAVGFCYSAHNAVLLTDALNAAVSERLHIDVGTSVSSGDATKAMTCEHGTIGYCEKCALRDPGELGEEKPHLVSDDKRERLWDIAGMLEFQATQALAMGELNVKIDAMTIVPKIVEVMRAASGPEVHSATLPSLAQLSDAIQYAVNYHSIDAKANIADYEIAHRIAPQVLERLQSYVGEKK